MVIDRTGSLIAAFGWRIPPAISDLLASGACQ
jgi:hypothetical protein